MFTFVKNIEVPQYSVFYSFIERGDTILGFGRNRYDDKKIRKLIFNKNFELLKDCGIRLIGEDPRIFEHDNQTYIVDNSLKDSHIINDNEYIKIKCPGKNFSFLSHDNKLYFIEWYFPFILREMDTTTGETKVIYTDDKIGNRKYRGGTPGYLLKDSLYYGFGHITDNENVIKHFPFLWILDMDKYELKVIEVEKPGYARDIMDPTCVLNLNEKYYLFTAESDHTWFRDQEYKTNMYEFCIDDLKIKSLE